MDLISKRRIYLTDAAAAARALSDASGRSPPKAPTGELPVLVDAIQEGTRQGPCLVAAYQQQTVRVDNLATEDRWLFAQRASAAGVASMPGSRSAMPAPGPIRQRPAATLLGRPPWAGRRTRSGAEASANSSRVRWIYRGRVISIVTERPRGATPLTPRTSKEVSCEGMARTAQEQAVGRWVRATSPGPRRVWGSGPSWPGCSPRPYAAAASGRAS
jgi:hypothetical protein